MQSEVRVSAISCLWYAIPYRHKIKDSDCLKQVLNSCWDTISQQLTNGATDQ